MMFLSLFRIRVIFLLFLWLLSAVEVSAAVYTLTINTNGSGMVSRNPTNSTYPEGSVVTITATPSNGWSFANWLGDASGGTNPLNVTMSSNKVITAHFQVIPSYTLTVAVAGQGSVSLDPSGGTYLSNSVVTATATPAAGWVFVNWTGDAGGSANPVSINMNTNKSVTSLFAQLPAIDSPPQNVTSGVGETTNFTVHAVGSPPLFYQWSFQNSPQPTATNTTLTLTNIQTTHEGLYSVVVTNAYGSATASAMLVLTNSCSGSNVVSEPTESALRAAINAGGYVRICCNGTITLSSTIDITRDVTLDARDRILTVSGNNAVRLFNVSSGVNFTVTNLTLANGRHVGQNGANAGTQPAQAGFPGEGGVIFNDGGTVQLVSSTLTNNSVVGGMGGAQSQQFPGNGAAGEGRGGAIFNRGGSVFLYAVTMSSNSAEGGPGVPGSFVTQPLGTAGNGLGGAVYSTNGSLLFVSCNLSNNFSTAPAGGIGAVARGGALFQYSGSLIISNSWLAMNRAFGGDTPESGSKPGSAYGGAIAALSGTVTIHFSRFYSNTAQGGNAYRHSGTGEAQGGSIFSSATIQADDSSFSGNQALSGNGSSINTDGRGGALHNSGPAMINRCAFYSNFAKGGDAGGFGSPFVNYPGGHGLGGAIFNLSQLAMTNCTIALNSVRGGAGGFPTGVPGSALGGGIYNQDGGFIGVNITVASNSVAAGQGYTFSGRGDGANVANTNGNFALRNSLLAFGSTNGNAWGPITDGGFNISSDGSANFSSGSSFNFTDPRLDPLANYGGPTLTMALRSSSPAIDFGTSIGAPATDQRGFSRPFGPAFDIGAYEFLSIQTDLPRLTIGYQTNTVLLTFLALPNTVYHLQASGTLSGLTDLETIGPFSSTTNVTRSFSTTSPSIRFFRLMIP